MWKVKALKEAENEFENQLMSKKSENVALQTHAEIQLTED